jgi:hypothetical protein
MTSMVDIIDMHFTNVSHSRSFFELLLATTAFVGVIYGLEQRT